MRRSSERILTTHAGSLPRPEHLTSLFVRRARGEGVDPVVIAKAGREALRAISIEQKAWADAMGAQFGAAKLRTAAKTIEQIRRAVSSRGLPGGQ